MLVIILILCTHIYIYTFVFCRGLINRPSKGIQGVLSCWAGAQKCWEYQSLLFFHFCLFLFFLEWDHQSYCYKTEKPPRDSDICLHTSSIWGKGRGTNFQSHGVFTFPMGGERAEDKNWGQAGLQKGSGGMVAAGRSPTSTRRKRCAYLWQ